MDAHAGTCVLCRRSHDLQPGHVPQESGRSANIGILRTRQSIQSASEQTLQWRSVSTLQQKQLQRGVLLVLVPKSTGRVTSSPPLGVPLRLSHPMVPHPGTSHADRDVEHTRRVHILINVRQLFCFLKPAAQCRCWDPWRNLRGRCRWLGHQTGEMLNSAKSSNHILQESNQQKSSHSLIDRMHFSAFTQGPSMENPCSTYQ